MTLTIMALFFSSPTIMVDFKLVKYATEQVLINCNNRILCDQGRASSIIDTVSLCSPFTLGMLPTRGYPVNQQTETRDTPHCSVDYVVCFDHIYTVVSVSFFYSVYNSLSVFWAFPQPLLFLCLSLLIPNPLACPPIY